MTTTDQQAMDLGDGWDLDEGSIFDDFTGTIVEAYFATDARIGNGQVLCLMLTFEGPELTKPIVEKFSCGKGWIAGDAQGETAVREDGAKKNFVKSSKVGLFITEALRVGAGPTMKAKGGTQFNAASYRGLKFHIKAIEKDYGGEIGVKKVRVPVAFLGTDDAATGDTSSAPAKAPAAGGAAVEESPLLAKVRELAATASTHDEFMEAAFAVPGVEDDAKVASAVMSTKPGSIWAVAQANK